MAALSLEIERHTSNSQRAAEEGDVPDDKASIAPSDGASDANTSIQAGANGAGWRYKGPALALLLSFQIGHVFTSATLGPLKSTIKVKVPGVTYARYGAISASDSLINGVLPIVSGVLTDYYGPGYLSVLSSTFIMIGAVVRAVGASRASFVVILGGQIIFGFSTTTLSACQGKLMAHWYRGTPQSGAGNLGLVTGLNIGFARVLMLVGGLVAVPIAQNTGNWAWTFWVGAVLCGFTLICHMAYFFLERRLPHEYRVVTGRQPLQATQASRKLRGRPAMRPFSGEHIRALTRSLWAIPAAFWLLAMTQVLQVGAVRAYNSNLAEVIEVTRGTTKSVAGFTSALKSVIPIVCTPIVGGLFDVFGRRMHIVTFTASIWVLVFALLAYTHVNALCPVLIGSIAFVTNIIPFLASIPLIVPSQACVGTAFGLWTAFNDAGTTIMDVAVGAIQDHTPTGSHQYHRVFYFLTALKGLDVFMGIAYRYLDKHYFGNVLTDNEKQRVAREAEDASDSAHSSLKGPLRLWTIAGFSVAAAMIATSYALYIAYTLEK